MSLSTKKDNIEKARVGVVILTFNRLQFLKIALRKVLDQSRMPFEILVVDNASQDGTPEFLDNVGVSKIILDENMGPAGGFYHGIKYFTDKNHFDFVWLMDDDFFPAKTCLEALLLESSLQSVVYPYVRGKDFETRLNPSWSGVLIPIKVIQFVGLPKKEFFFWGEDTEYLKHRIDEFHQITSKWIPAAKGVHFATRGANTRPAWRYYYETRNNLYIRLYVRKTHLKLAHRIYKAFKFWFFLLGGLVLKEHNKRRKLKYFFLGTYHGVFKRLGKRVDPNKVM